MVSGTARADAGALASCRELLRYLNHPRKLRDNVIVRRILLSDGQDGSRLSDSALASLIVRVVEFAIDGLSRRQASIVRRCAIGRERYTDVARSLSISERHAFRECTTALRLMLERLSLVLPITPTSAGSPLDAVWSQIAHAQAMEQNGNWRGAADVLERLESELPDDDRRCYVETRLTRLYVTAERFALATQHLGVARGLVTRLGDRTNWQHAEVDVAGARLMDATGDPQEADRLAMRACAELRSWSHTSAERRIVDALVDGLTLRAEKAFGEGAMATSASLARTACEMIDGAGIVDPLFVVAARDSAAMASWLQPEDWVECERRLLACYSSATEAGFTRQAIGIMAHLAGCWRLAGHPKAAVGLLEPLGAASRNIGIPESSAVFFYELASANLECGAVAAAQSYLTEMRVHTIGSPLRQAYAEFAAAKIHLAQNSYAEALRSAEAVESALTLLRKGRFLGASLRLQAEALAGLGQKERALKTIRLAVETLETSTQTAGLCAAYRVLARLSGNGKYAAMARRLLASRRGLKASSVRAAR